MRIHSQNLTADYLDRKERSQFWAGRAWLRGREYREIAHWEWAFGKYARDFAAWVSFGYGESNGDVCFRFCFPFLFSVFFILCDVLRCKEVRTGIAIHNQGFWLYPLAWENETRSTDGWFRRNHCWHFPWELNWYQTEILSHDLAKVVWKENTECKTRFMDSYDQRQAIEKSVSQEYPYRYVLENGEVQERIATVHATRMEWRARWYPIIWAKKVLTSISINFNQEVGEGSTSWKGGCVGCGYDLREGETVEQCLRRMESERKFNR